MEFGSHSFYETSYQQAYESVGSLSMVSIEQIKQDNNIDYLENVCTYIQQMNINPLWFESQNDRDKLKLLQLYQLAIAYSKNLSENYNIEIRRLQAINKKQKDENEEKVQQIKLQKEMFRKKKEQYKMQKHKRYKKIFHKLKDQLQEAEEESRVEQHPPYYPYPPYYGYPVPPHQIPPHYPHPNYSSQPTPYVQSSNQSPGQSIPLFNPQNVNSNPQQKPPMSIQQQLASNLMGRFGGLNNQRVNNQNNNNRISIKPQVPAYSANSNVLNTRKIERSFLKDEQSQEEYKEPMENSSQILNKYEINKMMSSNKPPSLNKKPLSLDKSKRKADINQNIVDDDFEDFGNLTAQSKKSLSKKQDSNKIHKQQIMPPPSIKVKKQQPPQSASSRFKKQETKTPSNRIKKQQQMEQASKNSNDSFELAQYDSIADMRLGNNQSKVQKGEKIHPFQSKIVSKGGIQNKKQKLSIPGSISSVNQTNSSQDLELAADSKFSKRNTSQNSKFLSQRPQRFSKTLAKDKQQNQDNTQSLGIESDSFNINLNLNSRMNVKKKEKRESSGEQYGQIDNSSINRKGKNHNQKKEPLQMMHDRPPQRRGNLKKIEQQKPNELRVSQAYSEGMNESKNKMMQSQTFKIETHYNALKQTNEDYNIKQSRMGINKSGNSGGSLAQPLFPANAHVKRASSDSNNQAQPSAKQQRNQAKQEQQNYQQRFEQYDDILNFNQDALQKSHIPTLSKDIKIEQDEYSMLDFDQQKLQQSHRPNSKKELKPQDPKQPQKSQVDIKIPSFNSLQQMPKYHKLTNQQFKLVQKKNTLNVQASTVKVEDSLQSFDDFIACIPANSVIAKPSVRFLPSKLIRQPKPKVNNPKSLQNLPIDEMSEGSTSRQNSINLISPDNEKEKLLTKKQQNGYKKQQQNRSKDKDNLRSSNLLVDDDNMLQSIILPNDSINKMLNTQRNNQEKANNYRPQVIAQKNVEIEEQQYDEILDSSFQDIAKSPKNQNQNDFRHQIMKMIKESENVDSLPISEKRFNEKLIQDTIKDICRVDLKNLQGTKLENVQKELQKQLQKMIKQKELKAKKLNDIIKQENIQIKQVLPRRDSQKQKPKPNKSGMNNDSLNYSRSFVNQKLESKNKNAKVEMKIDSNITESVVFDNPYTPQPNQSKLQEPPKQAYDRKSPKSANPFLIQNNKSLGTKQQHNLFKNVGQGISKYDKDDPLQRQITNMMNKKTKKQEEEDFDQW